MDELGTPRLCEDGLTYFPSLVKPSPEELIRSERDRQPGEWLSMRSGESLWVTFSLATPRQLLIGTKGMRQGDYATELGILGHALYDQFFSKDGLAYADPKFLRLIQLTLQAGYHVTEEMIEDNIFQITDADMGNILHIVFGLDPKVSAADPAPLPSAQDHTPVSQ